MISRRSPHESTSGVGRVHLAVGRQAYVGILRRLAGDYAELDARCAELTRAELDVLG